MASAWASDIERTGSGGPSKGCQGGRFVRSAGATPGLANGLSGGGAWDGSSFMVVFLSLRVAACGPIKRVHDAALFGDGERGAADKDKVDLARLWV
jgi:hypothetical protein